ncbi:DNA primase [Aerococcus tenax]|uniref:DNA primase n=1 Tax=Aerococcus tenax TaxID=3078812 RepID=A0A5N1BI01_9LACT|nr:DNA primase family protein [Aerococcus urinae]KAA9237493.1 DNA primase [Aerococcus urinae]
MTNEFDEVLRRARNLTNPPKEKAPRTMKEIRSALEAAGAKWHAEHQKENKSAPFLHEGTGAELFMQHVHCILIGNDRDKAMLAYYDPEQGLYISSENEISGLINCLEEYKYKHWIEVIRQLRIRVPLIEPFSSRDLIPVNNGIYSLKDHKLLPFSPKYAITSKIATNYNPLATKPIINGFDFDEWLKAIACGDEEVVTLLWQVINEALNPNHTRNKIGFLIGNGNSGKGTFQQLLINLIGKKNVSALKPPDFGSQFGKEALIGKVCNIGDDISNKYVDSISDLMSIATGDPIMIEEKRKPIFMATLKIFCLFSGNGMPNVRNKSTGWYRRLLLIPFNADFNGEKNDPNIKEVYLKDKAVLEYVLKTAIELDFTHFIEPEAVKKEIAKYRRANDFIEGFINDEYIPNGYHELGKVPNNFIKHDLTVYKEEMGNYSPLPYGFWTKFIEILERLTGNKYKLAKQRINVSESENMPEEIQPYAKGRNPIRIILKHE